MYNIIYTGQGHTKNPPKLTYIHTLPVLTWNEGEWVCENSPSEQSHYLWGNLWKIQHCFSAYGKSHIGLNEDAEQKSQKVNSISSNETERATSYVHN